MLAISEISSDWCGDGFTHPADVETLSSESSQYEGSTEGATGIAPSVIRMFDERPTCQSWEKNVTTLGMYGVRDLLPTSNMLFGVNARSSVPSTAGIGSGCRKRRRFK
jgi:hypothetical protein